MEPPRFRVTWMLLFFSTVTSASKQPVFSSAARDALYQGASSLTLRMANHHAEEERNLLFSPLGLALSFALVLEAAVGRTIDDVLETLHWELLRDADVRYVMAHGLLQLSKVPRLIVEGGVFVQRDLGVSQTYREALQEYYGADVVLVNLLDLRAALVAINAWACRMTAKVVPKLLDDTEIDSQARFLVASVVVLNITFERPFRRREPFHVSRDKSRIVEALGNTATYNYASFPEHGFRAVELRLASGNLSLFLAVPLEGSDLKMSAFSKQPELLLHELRVKMKETEVEVTLPRFKVIAVGGLKSTLTALGHKFLFDRFETNLATVTKHGRVFLSNIVSAVAVEIVGTPSEEIPPKSPTTVQFRADKPFLYFVLDRSEKLPLLIGQFNGQADW